MSVVEGKTSLAEPAEAAFAVERERTRAQSNMELWISYALRAGVLIAGAILILGAGLLLAGLGPAGGRPTQLSQILAHGGQPVPVTPAAVLHGVSAGNAVAIIQLGLLILILTPLLRVALTAVLFALQREPIFAAITTIVLAVLILGLAGVAS